MSVQEHPSIEVKTKKFYRAKELAEYLGIGLSTVWKYKSDGKIQAYKIGGTVTVFDLVEVQENLIKRV